MAPIENVDLLCNADITRPATQAEICRRLAGRSIDLLISDIAPNPTGNSWRFTEQERDITNSHSEGDANTDHVRIIHLCRALLQFGTTMKPITGIEGEQPSPLLAEDGVFLCKVTSCLPTHFKRVININFSQVFDGPLRKEFANQLREKFATVTIVKPEASRGTSSETYLFASGLLRE
jgi:23S rRNA U2552 (ribose-2'-O)-methylase RlmE/FtsJ